MRFVIGEAMATSSSLAPSCSVPIVKWHWTLHVIPIIHHTPPTFYMSRFIVMDSADVGDGGDAGAEDPGGECPSIPPDGEFIVPEPETRSAEVDDKIGLQMPYFMNAMLVLEGMSSTEDTNFLVAHHPLLHIGCFNGAIMTMDWTMQNSLSPTTLD